MPKAILLLSALTALGGGVSIVTESQRRQTAATTQGDTLGITCDKARESRHDYFVAQ